MRAIPVLDKIAVKGDEATGVDIVRRALPAPLPRFLDEGGWERRFGLARVG